MAKRNKKACIDFPIQLATVICLFYAGKSTVTQSIDSSKGNLYNFWQKIIFMETDPYIILFGLSFYFPSPSTNGNAWRIIILIFNISLNKLSKGVRFV